MKKLTAGIFAAILTVVGTNAADAAIASKGYVDGQIGDLTTLTTEAQGGLVGAINELNANKLDQADLTGYAKTTDVVANGEFSSFKETNTAAIGAKLATETYNTQVGTVSAETMGTTAATVVGAINEVAGKVSAAQGAATKAATAADQAKNAADTNTATLEQMAWLLKNPGECTNAGWKCALVIGEGGQLAWEVIERSTTEVTESNGALNNSGGGVTTAPSVAG